MTNPNKTHIGILVDRSGSMSSIAEDMQGGLNSFTEEQKKVPGECTCTIMQFDNPGDNEYLVKNKNIQEIESINNYTPRGLTALFDALGQFIVETGEYLASLEERDRPGKVLILIITDGGENASTEYTRERVKEMIEHQTQVYNWEFTYLGVDDLSLKEASSLSISNKIIHSKKSVNRTFSNLSADTKKYRENVSYSVGTGSFSDTEDYSV